MSRWRRLSWELEKESVISRMSLYPSSLYRGFESYVYACPTLRGVRVDNRSLNRLTCANRSACLFTAVTQFVQK